MLKKLAVFDFDHTIVDDNTDTVVRDLIPRDLIPSSVRELHKSDGWTAYMQAIFDLLHRNRIEEDTVKATVEAIKPTKGMRELITELSNNHGYDVIIISDSNSYFINAWLTKWGLDGNVLKVFTNPAFFTRGLLKIRMYHLQIGCRLSTKNLCKGRILDEFLESQGKKNVSYESVVYIGDGLNDFCPILRLKQGDLACVRDKYKCHELVKLAVNKKPIDGSGVVHEIKSDVHVWTDGLDILDHIKKGK